MSGHSKWHNIQGKKGKADKARSNVFTKMSRMITVSTREGGNDPEMNFSLRLAIEKAKAANMPKENIERAIKRGTGELKDGAVIEEALYEGFGPGGVVMMIEALTDNKNRTVSEIKNTFTKHGCNLAGPGSVQWQFTRLGVVRIDEVGKEKIKDKKTDFELALIDAGAEDISEHENGVEINCAIPNLKNVLEALKKFGIEPESSALEWVAKENVELDEETGKRLGVLYEALDEMDDVRAVYTNAA